MLNHRCKDCAFWDSEHIRVQFVPRFDFTPSPGLCRKKRPSTYMYEGQLVGIFPIVDALDWCGEWKADKEG